MPRRRRGWIDNACYHITHRCHEREFLFKHAKYREQYRQLMWEAAKRFRIIILDYIITSNHVHLLLKARHGNEISKFLQFLHGTIAQKYNLAKKREGAFWSDRFHATRIQNGAHLGTCLFYIDLNMVRAGAVTHPGNWQHGSYAELMGQKKRNCLIDLPELLQTLEISEINIFRDWYNATLADKLNMKLNREPFWSTAIAVGDEGFLKEVVQEIDLKRHQVMNFQTGYQEIETVKINFLLGRKSK